MNRHRITVPLEKARSGAWRCLICWLVLWCFSASRASALKGAPSPLIFGSNLGLYSAGDQFLQSAATRSLLARIGVRLVRMPIRSVLSPGVPSPGTAELQAARDIRRMGATPIVILHFRQGDAPAEGRSAVHSMNRIFGSRPVYYELGNEVDLTAGVTPERYTAVWNALIPSLARLARNGRFVGPVTFQAKPQYVAYFWHHARPRPFAVSWHEYTCDNSATAQECIDNTGRWSAHIAATRAAVRRLGDPVPRIMITEWNYDPNSPIPDPRATPEFQRAFTETALRELVRDGVFAAAHYVALGHAGYDLIDAHNRLTPEGLAFAQAHDGLTGRWWLTGPGRRTPPVLPSTSSAQTRRASS